MSFVVCSSGLADSHGVGTPFQSANGLLEDETMTMMSTRVVLFSIALGTPTGAALAQAAAPTPWVLSQDMGYGYDKEGKTFAYKMGTRNAALLLKGAKKVPKGTLFFIGENGQLYMRTGPFLDGSGKFDFGPN
jgi:hypothetical protein